MSILIVGSWVTKAAGRLFSSGLGLYRPRTSRTNLTQPVPRGSLLEEWAPQVKTDCQVRSYSKLRLLHQEASSLSIGLDCLSNEAKQRKKEHDCSHSVVNQGDFGNNVLALPPLSFYLAHFICPVNERASDDTATLEPEAPQPAGRSLAGISAVLSTTQTTIAAVNSMTRAAVVYLDRAGILNLITRTRAEIVPFFTMTRARIETFFNMARAIVAAVISRDHDRDLLVLRCWIRTAFHELFKYVAAAFSRIRRRTAPVLPTARARAAPFLYIARTRIADLFTETREEMEAFFPSDYHRQPEVETLITSASLNQQIQRRRQLHALSSVFSDVFYWKVSDSRMPQPPYLSLTPSVSVANDIPQMCLDRLIVATLPLCGMCGPIVPQNAPESNFFALMQAAKNVVFTMTRTVYGMTRTAASSLYGIVWTLSANLYDIARAQGPGVVRLLIYTLYRLVRGTTHALVRTWQVLFTMALVCFEAFFIHMTWIIIAECRFSIAPTLIPIIIMPLVIDMTFSRGLEIYRNFTAALEGILPDETVRPVAAVLTTFRIINRAQLIAFIIACPLGTLMGIERHYQFLSILGDDI